MTNLDKYDELTTRIRHRINCSRIQCDNCPYDYSRCYSQFIRDIRALHELIFDIDLHSIHYGTEPYKTKLYRRYSK